MPGPHSSRRATGNRSRCWHGSPEETGELAREINHRFGEKPKKAGEPEQDIGEEISDIIFVLLSLANSLRIDMDEAWARMMEKYRTRDAGRWTRKPDIDERP